jgi:hypothetical protein
LIETGFCPPRGGKDFLLTAGAATKIPAVSSAH